MKALEKYLAETGILQKDFAERVGCSQSRLSQLLSGQLPSRSLIERIEIETGGKVSFRDWVPARQSADSDAA